jgi:hypothetical protein
MRITQSQLRQIIKEELKAVLNEKAEKTVSAEISAQKKKGKPQDQAVAIALSKQERGEIDEKKKKGKDDRCTRIAKRKYDVWPSAYASGAVVKCRQGKIWKGVSEGREEDLAVAIRQALHDEGGAAGMEALIDKVGASQKEIEDAIGDMHDVGHSHYGDYILDDADMIDVVK